MIGVWLTRSEMMIGTWGFTTTIGTIDKWDRSSRHKSASRADNRRGAMIGVK